MEEIIIQAKRYAEQAKAYCEQTQCYISEIKELLTQIQEQRAQLEAEGETLLKEVGGISAHMGEKYLEIQAQLSTLKGENTEG